MLWTHAVRAAAILALTTAITLHAAASQRCSRCHPDEVQGFLQTGMGRSITRPLGQPSGKFRHSRSGTKFTITATDSGMTQRAERDGLMAEYPVEYVIGSGNAAFSYAIRIGNHLFQTPVAYYTKRRVWDMAPGMEDFTAPEFDRPIAAECLWCHAGRPRPIAGTLNQYRDPAFEAEAISCGRCHGPADLHLAQPSAQNIINPRKLPPEARNSVCEQCHLGGRARVPNPGQGFGDFQPGMELEEVFSVYIHEDQWGFPSAGTFRVTSHAEQLALSRCAEESGGNLWCGTCHDPHAKPRDPVSYYRQRCLDCHGESLLAKHSKPSENCVGCHLMRRRSEDSGHSAFTDHRISRRPPVQSQPAKHEKLKAWRQPPEHLTQRNLGLAYVQIGHRESVASHLDEGYTLLVKAARAFPNDPEILRALGLVLTHKDATEMPVAPKLVLGLFESMLEQRPGYAPDYPFAAAAWWELKRPDKAVSLLERAIALDPLLQAGYESLAKTYEDTGRPAEALKVWERYLKVRPQSMQGRQAVRRLKRAAAQ